MIRRDRRALATESKLDQVKRPQACRQPHHVASNGQSNANRNHLNSRSRLRCSDEAQKRHRRVLYSTHGILKTAPTGFCHSVTIDLHCEDTRRQDLISEKRSFTSASNVRFLCAMKAKVSRPRVVHDDDAHLPSSLRCSF